MAKFYIAGPFFNEPQRNIIGNIERMLTRHGHDFYSPRLHSGSADMTPEQRKDPAAWEPVFESNVQRLLHTDIVLAVTAYPLEPDQRMGVLRFLGEEIYTTPDPNIFDCRDKARILGGQSGPHRLTPLELPDSGTVWEMGAAYIVNRFLHNLPVVGFHPGKDPAKLNLMLMKGCVGFITDWTDFELFVSLGEEDKPDNGDVWQQRWDALNRNGEPSLGLELLDWSMLSVFAGEVE